jgi:hypothetical protein
MKTSTFKQTIVLFQLSFVTLSLRAQVSDSGEMPRPNYIGVHASFRTIDGDDLNDVTIKKITPDGIVVAYADGVRKLPFRKLSVSDQEKYGYDPIKAATFLEEENKVALENQKKAAAIEVAQLNQLKPKQENINESVQIKDSPIASPSRAIPSLQSVPSKAGPSWYNGENHIAGNPSDRDHYYHYYPHHWDSQIVVAVEHSGIRVRDPRTNRESFIRYTKLTPEERQAFGFPPPSENEM